MKQVRSKKWLAVGAGLSLFALAACGGGTSDSGSADAGGDEGATEGESQEIRVLMETVPDSDIVIEMLDAFYEDHPDITVEIEQLAFDQMRDRLISSFQSPQATYDLIVVDNPWMVDFANAGFLEPLDDRIAAAADFEADDFFQPLVDITTVDDVQYAVPFYNYALAYIYRQDLYDEHGLSEPETLTELVENSRVLTEGDRAGLAMQPQRGYKIFEEWANWLFAAGGSIFDDEGNVTLETPEAVTALETYVEAYNEVAPDNSLNWSHDEAVRSVQADLSAALVTYNWNLPALNDPEGASGELAGNFKLAPMPGGKQVLGSWSWAIPANSGAADAAWEFISWVTSPDVDVERVIRGGAAIRESTLQVDRVRQEGFGEEYYDAVIEILSNASPLSETANGEEMIQAVGTELNMAVSGSSTAEEALKAAQKAAERIQQ